MVAVFVLYGQAADHAFVAFDDDRYVYDHPMVVDGLTWEGIGRAWTLSPSADYRWDPHGNWHPLTWLSLMTDSALYGAEKERAGGYILTNALLHAANAVLLLIVLRRLTGRFWLSVIVTALFAFHPLRVEAVAWACQRKEVLSSLFGLIAMLVYTRYAERPSWVRYAVVMVALSLSMASKQTLVALPVGLLVLDVWPLKRTPWNRSWLNGEEVESLTETQPCPVVTWKQLILEKIPLLAICAAAAAAAFLGVHLEGGTHSADVLTVPVRVLNAAIAYVTVLGKTLWPADLAIFYPHPALVYDDALQRLLLPGLAAIALLLTVTGLVLWQLKKRPYLAAGWFWYILMFLPMSGLSQAGFHAMADRFTYIPSVGLLVMIVWGLFDVSRQWQRVRGVCVVMAPIVIVGYATMSYLQIATWQNTITVFQHALKVTDRNYMAHYNVGRELADRGYRSPDRESATRHFKEAEYHFEEACRLFPALARHHLNLGLVLQHTGRRELAIEKFKDALEQNRDDPKALLNLGVALASVDRHAEAIPYLRRALALEGFQAEVMAQLAGALYVGGEMQEAIDLYRKSLAIRPDIATANELAMILATSPDSQWRNGAEAIRIASKTVELTERQHAASLDTLAAALAESGRFDEAVEVAREALGLLQDSASDSAVEIRRRLKFYESGKPYRQPVAADKDL